MSCVLQDRVYKVFYLLAGIIILVPKINTARLSDLSTKLLTCGLLFTGPETESVLVDTSAPRREALEPEQLPHGYDPGTWWSGGHPGAHTLQGHLLPHVGGSVLVRETLIWPCRANWSLVVHQEEFLAQAVLILL